MGVKKVPSAQEAVAPPSGPPVTTDSLTTTQSAALEAQITQLLQGFGLADLTSWAVSLLNNGATSQAQIEIELEDQPAFRERFGAIFARREAGLSPVSVEEVLYFEKQVGELESFYGFPAGTLDAQDFLAEDRSYNEIQATVAAEVQFRQSDPDTQRYAQQFYGIGATQGEVIGAIINSDIGVPALQQRLQAAAVAGEASAQGFGELTAAEAEDLVSRGIDEKTAAQTFNLLSRSEQLTRDFSRSQLLSLAAGEAPAIEELERKRGEALSVFDQGGAFAGTVGGLAAT